MLLESLLALVEKLRGRIETHGSLLRRSEAQTRYALIDPLLRELGWDTEDPDMVVPEYTYGGNRERADYALMNTSSGKPVIMVEAKKLDESFGNAVQQGINVCLNTGSGYFVATDGKRWEIYEAHKQVPLDQKRIASFDLMSGVPSEVCLKALVLWRHNVASGSISPAQTPIAGVVSGVSSGAAQSTDAISAAEPASVMAQVAPTNSVMQDSPPSKQSDANDGWQPISDVQPKSRARAPKQMMFPDQDNPIDIRIWGDVVIELVRWLTDNGRLGEDDFPIPHNDSRYIVADKPIHPGGRSFGKKRREVNSRYVALAYGAPDVAGNARIVIERAGMDASQFKLRW